jgi:hypothetical protein
MNICFGAPQFAYLPLLHRLVEERAGERRFLGFDQALSWFFVGGKPCGHSWDASKFLREL